VGKVKRWKGGEERERGKGRERLKEKQRERNMINLRKIQKSNEWNLFFKDTKNQHFNSQKRLKFFSILKYFTKWTGKDSSF
jgi:hypothetical protein